MSQTPEQYGSQRETLDRARGAVAAADSRAVFGKVMFLVAVTAGFAAAGAYIGRDLSTGWAFACWGGALVLTIAMSFSKRREEVGGLQLTMPVLIARGCEGVEDGGTIIAQAAGLTALFMGVMGTVGYVTKRDLTWLGRVSFIALLGLLVFGIVAIFVSIPNAYLFWSVAGLVIFAGLTTFDFWRLRRAGDADVVLISLSIFLDAFNVFLFFLQILGGGGRN